MARQLRLEYPGAVYHISSRGNHQEHIFLDDDDRKLFLKLLKTIIERMNWICHAYCLMGNHYHLLVEIPDGILSRGMAWLNGVYTQRINRKYGLTGHLFQGRFKTKLVEDGMQFLMTARYIVRNPVEAKIVENPVQWRWSSYRATIGEITPPDFLFVDDVLSQLSSIRENAQMFFKALVQMELKGNDGHIIKLFQKVYREERNPLSSKRIGPMLDMKDSSGSLPRNQRILSRPQLQELFEGGNYGNLKTRNRIIRAAFTLYAYTQSEIATFLELDRTTISKIVNKTDR
jgi:REP element-mobilizing transposase RayT